jgi:hypothetical protein
MKKELADCFLDAAEERHALTESIAPYEIATDDLLVGIIRMNTSLAIGFIFVQRENGREMYGEPLYCLADEQLNAKELLAIVQQEITKGQKIPHAAAHNLKNLIMLILADDRAPVFISGNEFIKNLKDFYGMPAYKFDKLARVLTDDERAFKAQINTNLFSRKSAYKNC